MLYLRNKALIFVLFVLQERYRNDVNLAIQLLQCKPANFVSHKFDMVNNNVLFGGLHPSLC
jgi:hypothetical protein